MKSSVVITESVSNLGSARILCAGEVYAVQSPASRYRNESWHIVARLDIPPAEVYSEEAARNWLQFLATTTGIAETSPAMEDSTPTAIAPGAAPSPAGIQHIPGAATAGRTGHTRSALVTAAANQLEVWRKNFDLELCRDQYLAELIPELRDLATELAVDGD